MLLSIKALSVNDAWNTYCTRCGSAKHVRRVKTDKYKGYAAHLAMLLRPIKVDFSLPIRIEATYGFSSHGSDVDNPAKPMIDVMQKKYGFNDNGVYELIQRKEIVSKGKEFIDLNIENMPKLTSVSEIKIPVSIGVRRWVKESFDETVSEMGFSRSEVVEQLMLDFLKLHRGNHSG